jgi:hypothetical protein
MTLTSSQLTSANIVVADTAPEAVVSATCEDAIVALAAMDVVGPGARDHEVVAVPAKR